MLAALCLAFSGTSSAARVAHAQEQPSATSERVDPAGYAALIDEALAEHQALNFEEARTLFAKAHAIFPNARTLRGMGMMEFELRDYAAGAEQLEQALASQVRPLAGEHIYNGSSHSGEAVTRSLTTVMELEVGNRVACTALNSFGPSPLHVAGQAYNTFTGHRIR
jgi:hypothetical protein